MIHQAVFCAARASFLALFMMVRQVSKVGKKVFPIGGYACGLYPWSRRKGKTLVELWGEELCWNSAVGRNLVQPCGQLEQKIQR